MRGGDDDGLLRRRRRAVEACVDAGGRVDEDIVEAGREVVEDQPHRLRRYVLVRVGVVGGEHEQVGVLRVLHERLLGSAAPLDRVHNVVDDPVFHAADDVDVVQPEIGIRQHDPLPHHGEPHAEVGGDGRLAHAALARCDHNFARHVHALEWFLLLYHCNACARAFPVCLRRRRGKFAKNSSPADRRICA